MPFPEKIALYALTKQGWAQAKKLAEKLSCTLFVSQRLHPPQQQAFTSLTNLVATQFSRFEAHIFFAATGIVVRCIAPHLCDKQNDPAIICLDQNGHYAISLLSGHLGGGNALARRCAAILNGEAVITTATDTAGLPSLDMLAEKHNMKIGNISHIKVVNCALLDGQSIQIFDPDNRLGVKGLPIFRHVTESSWNGEEPGVWVSIRDNCPTPQGLRLFPRILMLGIGCRRGVATQEIFDHLRTVFESTDFSLHAIGGIASIDAKKDECGLLQVAKHLDVPIFFYNKTQLSSINAPNPSETVRRRMGVGSVCEAAALLLAQEENLLIEKTKTQTVTLAVAQMQ